MQIWPWNTKWSKAKTEFCQENALVIANTLFQQHKRRLYTWTSPDGQYWDQIDYILCSQRWRNYTVSKKQDRELTIAQIMNSLLPNSDLNWRTQRKPLDHSGTILNQIPYDYTVEVRIRFKGLDLTEYLMNYGRRFMILYMKKGSRPSPRKRNAKRQNGCLRKSYK